ncbi:pilus assembly protein PilM [bacterium]|nr:pilus assembly protein PilM [bacterium]
MGFKNLLLKFKKFSDCLLALDIGTEFAKAVIFRIDLKSNRAIIKGIGRHRHKSSDISQGVITDIMGVTDTCKIAINKAKNIGKCSPKKLIMGIGGELLKGYSNSFVYKRDDPEKEIDLSEFKNIVQKAQWKALDNIRESFLWETARQGAEVKLINADVTDLRIDGYKVANPLGFKGREIYLTIFNICAPLIHLSALKKISNLLNLKLANIVGNSYALNRALNFENSFIIIDIGGISTEIIFIKNKEIISSKTFPIGGKSFTNALARKLGLDYFLAEDIKLKYTRNQLGLNARKKIREILKEITLLWLNGVELSLSEISSDSKISYSSPLPERIFLCGGGANLSEVKDALRGKFSNWCRNLPFSGIPEVKIISADDISNILDEKKLLCYPEDTILGCLANSGLGLVKEKNISEQVLSQAIRIIQN